LHGIIKSLTLVNSNLVFLFSMHKQKISFFLLFIFVGISSSVFSQIVATPSSGCVPQTISFTSPPGATACSWNFGDLGTSVILNPGHNYVTAGNFNVVCNYTAGGVPSTTTLVVPVFPKPTAAFNFALPSSHCAPETVTFTNLSSGNPAPIVTYTWNMGDGTPLYIQSPTHTYGSGGTYTVFLSVTDVNGCTGTVSGTPIFVSNIPVVNIQTNPNPPSGCQVPFVVNFNGSGSTSGSPTGGGLGYSWTFNGGTPGSSGSSVPGNVTYAATGSYNASLTVTDNNNCSASGAVPVNVSQATLTATGPNTACINGTYSVNVQSNAATIISGAYVNNSSGLTNVTYTFSYPLPGVYTYTVLAGVSPCTNSVVKTVSVTSITASITASTPTFGCGSPFVCNYFNSSSPNAVTYSWSVINCNGQVLNSNAQNPTFSLTQGSQNPYTIYPYCAPIVSLVVSSANGCTAVATIQADALQRPTAWFNKNKKEGCAPLVVTYRDTSFAYPSPLSIVAYTWNNGASPPTFSSGVAPPIPNATFTYNTPGTYTPYLIIQTSQGCIDTSFVDTITVVNPTPISFTVSPLNVCPGQSVTVNMAASSPTVQHWHVQSDAGFFSGCVSNANPQWAFTHIGVHGFTVSAWKNSCQSSTTSPVTVTVNGPIVQSRFTTDCNNRFTVFFDTHVQDGQNGSINFGDLSPVVNFPCIPGTSIQHTVNHTYAATGDYTAVVTASNAVCPPQTYTMLVQVRNITAGISSGSTVCSGFSSVFSSTPSVDVLVGCPNIGYTWYFDNAPPIVTSLTAVSYSWGSPGIHTVTLLVKDVNSCSDTKTTTIRVSSAAANFSFAPSQTICLSTGTVQFINTTPQVPDVITAYYWDFGNGTNSVTMSNPVSNYTAALTPYSIYNVILTATNALGCVGTTMIPLQVNNPNATFYGNPSNSLCVNAPVSIISPTGYPSYTLSLGDGSVVIGPSYSVAYSYSLPGTYPASLNIIDAGGCKNSSTLNFYVQDYPSFVTFNNLGSCVGDVTFSSTVVISPTNTPLTYIWNPGYTATLASLPTVIATYTNTGTYTVTLNAMTSFGCAKSYSKTITLYNPQANIMLSDSIICLGETVKFTLKDSSKVFAWTWDFGVGDTLRQYTGIGTPTVNYTYTNYPQPSGIAYGSLIYYSSAFICKQSPRTFRVYILKMDANFDRNNELIVADSVHCIGTTDTFSPIITNPGPNSYTWNFGGGSTSNLPNPNYIFPVAGIYPVTLTVQDVSQGCMGFAVKNMTINPLPNAGIFARDTCANAPFPLLGSATGNGPFTYTWDPPGSVTNANILSTTASASTSMVYTLSITDKNGCKDTASRYVFIQQAPKNIMWDTTIIIGQIAPMNGYAGNNMSYTWTPSTSLTCVGCINPVSSVTDNITYTVTVADNMGCFSVKNIFEVKVDPRATIDVPTAFTPNGDGTNDLIFPDGWGIKKVNYFRVYNRWGQLLFETNEFKVGWDGKYNGVEQNMETYVYQVSVETYVDKEALLKTGSFKLIR
jgi:gliding motility-associated-like protein